MNAPQPAPANPPVEPLSVRSQMVVGGILMLMAVCIGWRWWQDHHTTRPAERVQDVTHRIDLNRASRGELLQLPNIGPKLADQIVNHRNHHGPFKQLDDLKDVHGIGDATLNKIRPWLTVEEVPDDHADLRQDAERLMRKSEPSTTGKRINVNTASTAELETLPNIGKVLAQRIIDERTKKPFTNVQDLRRVSGIGPKRIEALKDWVTTGE